jgi:hypothetical protein
MRKGGRVILWMLGKSAGVVIWTEVSHVSTSVMVILLRSLQDSRYLLEDAMEWK